MARRKKGLPINGWALIDKPLGMTSTQVVGKVRWSLNAQKAGHGGTLDPLATGVLPIALGEATKTVPYVMDGLKTYEFTAQWGERRDTDDSEGAVIATSDVRPDSGAIEAALPGFEGEIRQTPPTYSAIKVDGARAYDLAREGEEVELRSRWVYCDSIRLIDVPDAGRARFELVCGKGFYVRSLVRDLAQKLGTEGHVSTLRRTRVGPFDESDTIPLDKWLEMGDSPPPSGRLLPVETALDDIPALAVSVPDAARLKRGQAILVHGQPNWLRSPQELGLGVHGHDSGPAAFADPVHGSPGSDDPADSTVLCQLKGRPIALCQFKGLELKPMRVFNLT